MKKYLLFFHLVVNLAFSFTFPIAGFSQNEDDHALEKSS